MLVFRVGKQVGRFCGWGWGDSVEWVGGFGGPCQAQGFVVYCLLLVVCLWVGRVTYTLENRRQRDAEGLCCLVHRWVGCAELCTQVGRLQYACVV